MSENRKMLYDTHETPPAGQLVTLAVQHVFAMFGATVLVPILVNSIAGATVLSIPVALVTAGIGTLIYLVITKGKSPVYLGSSFAFITPIAVSYLKTGYDGVMTGIFILGMVYTIVGLIIKATGTGWFNKMLPPIVVGPMIMIIGLGLAPSAVSQMGLSADDVINMRHLIVVLATFISTVFAAIFAKGFLKVIPFLVGIVVGYFTSILVGIVDLQPILDASWLSLPQFIVPFVHYTPNFSAVFTIVPIALVTMAEHIGDHKALSAIIGKDLIKDPGLDKTLMGDGIATAVAGLLGGPANTTYGENTAVVGMSKVASVKVIGLAAIISICFGFLGKLTAIFNSIPAPVFGSISVILYGFIAVNGLKMLVQNQIDFDDTKNVIVASTMLVLGLGGAVLSVTTDMFTLSVSGMSLAAIIGIALNLLLPNESK